MMPEGPEVRTLVDQLQVGIGQRLVNLKFVSGRYMRHGKPKGFEAFRKTMTSYEINSDKDIDTVTDWQCKGKFIYLTLDHGMNHHRSDDDDFLRSIWITLGMSGRFARDAFQLENDNGTSHNQPRWYFEFLNEKNPSTNDTTTTTTTRATTKTTTEMTTRKIYYYDTRNFGTLRFSLSKAELEDKIDSLGPDILNPQDCTEEVFLDLFRKHRQSMNICKFLMDQAKISGVGNYILAEGLYKAKVDPFASLHEIGDNHAKDLYRALVNTATASYQSQGMTRKGGSYRDVEGNKGQFAFSLLCYGQDVTVDGEPVLRETNGRKYLDLDRCFILDNDSSLF
jgi:formamidopyrimidine-DNA glycosylase